MNEPTEEVTDEDVYEEMDELEPYTTRELAASLGAPIRRLRDLLERLSADGRIRKKTPDGDRAIWIREAPTHECPNCDYTYEVKFLHPVLSAVRYCPRCGSEL